MKAAVSRVCKLGGLFFLVAFAEVLSAEAGEAGKIRVLVVTGGHGFDKEPFLNVFKTNPAIDWTLASHAGTNATVYERDDLLSYQAIVLYDLQKEITEAQKKKFLALFEHGIGLVVLHHALVSYQHWPDYERIIGGRYPEADGRSGAITPEVGYRHDVEVPVVIVAKEHPITAGLTNFIIHDEIYWGFRVQPDVVPLLTTTLEKSAKPLAWTREQSKSRVVYLQLGHDHSAYENPNYRELVARSITWVARR
jgi:type 1 glutamine amidotransferase